MITQLLPMGKHLALPFGLTSPRVPSDLPPPQPPTASLRNIHAAALSVPSHSCKLIFDTEKGMHEEISCPSNYRTCLSIMAPSPLRLQLPSTGQVTVTSSGGDNAVNGRS